MSTESQKPDRSAWPPCACVAEPKPEGIRVRCRHCGAEYGESAPRILRSLATWTGEARANLARQMGARWPEAFSEAVRRMTKEERDPLDVALWPLMHEANVGLAAERDEALRGKEEAERELAEEIALRPIHKARNDALSMGIEAIGKQAAELVSLRRVVDAAERFACGESPNALHLERLRHRREFPSAVGEAVRPDPSRCREHGGYGFMSDCVVCNPPLDAPAVSPPEKAEAPDRDEKRRRFDALAKELGEWPSSALAGWQPEKAEARREKLAEIITAHAIEGDYVTPTGMAAGDAQIVANIVRRFDVATKRLAGERDEAREHIADASAVVDRLWDGERRQCALTTLADRTRIVIEELEKERDVFDAERIKVALREDELLAERDAAVKRAETAELTIPANRMDAPRWLVCACGRASVTDSGWCGVPGCYNSPVADNEPAASPPESQGGMAQCSAISSDGTMCGLAPDHAPFQHSAGSLVYWDDDGNEETGVARQRDVSPPEEAEAPEEGCWKHGNIHCTACSDDAFVEKLRARIRLLESRDAEVREAGRREGWAAGVAALEQRLQKNCAFHPMQTPYEPKTKETGK